MSVSSWQDFNTIGLTYDAVGVLVLWAPSLWRWQETAKAEAGTYWGHNPALLQGTIRARLDLTFGSILLLTGFVGQLLEGLGFSPLRLTAVALWLGLPMLVITYLGWLRRRIASAYSRAIEEQIVAEQRAQAEAERKEREEKKLGK